MKHMLLANIQLPQSEHEVSIWQIVLGVAPCNFLEQIAAINSTVEGGWEQFYQDHIFPEIGAKTVPAEKGEQSLYWMQRCNTLEQEIVDLKSGHKQILKLNMQVHSELLEAALRNAAASLETAKNNNGHAEAWQETARNSQEIVAFCCGILERIATVLGPDVFVSDDGSVQNSPILLKVPELVERAVARLNNLLRDVENILSPGATVTKGDIGDFMRALESLRVAVGKKPA